MPRPDRYSCSRNPRCFGSAPVNSNEFVIIVVSIIISGKFFFFFGFIDDLAVYFVTCVCGDDL